MSATSTATARPGVGPARPAALLMAWATTLTLTGSAWLVWLAGQPSTGAAVRSGPHGVAAWMMTSLLALPVVIGGVWVSAQLARLLRRALSASPLTVTLHAVLVSGAASAGLGTGWHLQTAFAGADPPLGRLFLATILVSPATLAVTLLLTAVAGSTHRSPRLHALSSRRLPGSPADAPAAPGCAAADTGPGDRDPKGPVRSPRRSTANAVRRLTGALLALVAGALTVLVTALPASAHAALLDTDPAPSSVVDQAPATVRMRFSEPVQVTDGSVAVTGPNGDELTGLSPAADPDDGNTLVASLPDSLPDGTYVVSWRVVSLDSHPISGRFAFAVGAPSAPLLQADSSTLAGPTLLGGTGRAMAAAGALAVTGMAAFPLLVLAPARRRLRDGAALDADARRRLHVPLAVAGAVAAVGTVAVLVDTALDAGSSLVEVALGTRSGLLLVARLVLVVVTVAVLTTWFDRPQAGPRERRVRLGVALAGALGVLATFSLSSHAAAAAVDRTAALTFDFAHLVAAGAWTGGLLALALAGIPAARAVAGHNTELVGEGAAALFGRFSVVAQVAMVAVLMTGLYPAVLEVSGLSDLGQTTWGLALTAKVALWASIMMFAAANAFTFVPALAGRAGAAARRLAAVDQLRSAVRVELGLAAVLIVVAAVMSASPQPAQQRAAEAQQQAPQVVSATATGSSQGYVATVHAIRAGGVNTPTVFHVDLFTASTPVGASTAAVALRRPDGTTEQQVLLRRQGAGAWAGVAAIAPGDYRLTARFERHGRVLSMPLQLRLPATPLTTATGPSTAEQLERARTALTVSLAGILLSAGLAGLVHGLRRRHRLVPAKVVPAVGSPGPPAGRKRSDSRRRQ
jgi:copper transport protein